jgi:hypothetical protein
MTTRKTPDAVTGRTKAIKSSPTGKGQRRGMVLLSPEQQKAEDERKSWMEERRLSWPIALTLQVSGTLLARELHHAKVPFDLAKAFTA